MASSQEKSLGGQIRKIRRKEVIRISEEDGATEGQVILSSWPAHFPPDLNISLIVIEQKTRWASRHSRRGHKFAANLADSVVYGAENKKMKMDEVEDQE